MENLENRPLFLKLYGFLRTDRRAVRRTAQLRFSHAILHKDFRVVLFFVRGVDIYRTDLSTKKHWQIFHLSILIRLNYILGEI